MRPALLLLPFLASPALAAAEPDASLRAVREAAEKTGRLAYAYVCEGRFRRTGEFQPPDLLTSRIGPYRSVRRGDAVLVKGHDGIWKAPGDPPGTQAGPPPPEAADMLKVLETAEPPHRLLLTMLDKVDKGSPGRDLTVDWVRCREHVLTVDRERLRDHMEWTLHQMIERGEMKKPEGVVWTSLKGSLRVFVGREEGVVVRAVGEWSVKIKQGGVKVFRSHVTLEFTRIGKAVADLPEGVRERLEAKKGGAELGIGKAGAKQEERGPARQQ